MIKMADEMDQLFNDIMSECKSGKRHSQFSDSVRDRLEKYERSVRREIVSRQEDNHAPLYEACEMGHVEMVEYLISTCDADVEQRGCWRWTEDMVSPLWCAADCGHTPVIECLVRHGAQVNAISKYGTTPFGKACENVKFEVVKCLVKHGADVNARDGRNKTALHYAIEYHRLDMVKLLLDYGADVTLRSLENDDALQTACLVQSEPIFDYLVEHGSYSPGRLADANELMGSRYFRETQTAVQYWRKAMEIRNSNTVDGNPLAKTTSMPKSDCYRNASEFTTLDELNAIALDSDAWKIQHILIHERILGEHHRATFEALKRISTSLYTNPVLYEYCFDLRRRALEISVVNEWILWKDVAEVARGLVRAMIKSHEQIPLGVADPNRVNKKQPRFADFVAIFKLLTSRLVTVQPSSEELLKVTNEGHSYDKILECISDLIDMLVKMAKTSEDADEVRALVRHLVNQNPMSPNTHDTLLHLCVFRHVIRDDLFSRVCGAKQFGPRLEVVKLLLECGADVTARNRLGKTALHIASCSPKICNPLLKLLIDHGAHLDTPDICGSTPAKKISANPRSTVNLENYMTLRCFAAQAIVKYSIQCNDLPVSVNQFLDLHRRSIETTKLRRKRLMSD